MLRGTTAIGDDAHACRSWWDGYIFFSTPRLLRPDIAAALRLSLPLLAQLYSRRRQSRLT